MFLGLHMALRVNMDPERSCWADNTWFELALWFKV